MEYRLKTEVFQIDSDFLAIFHHSFAAEIEQKQINNMSPFAIFAIVLTIAYIIYYGVNISRDLYGKKGQENEAEEIFNVSTMTEIEDPIPVTEDGDGFVIGAQKSLENISEANPLKEQGEEEKENDDSYRSETATQSGMTEKSKTEEQVDTIRQNMIEGDIQSEVVMDEKEFEDYLINQQVVLFDNQRQDKGLKEVKASDNEKSENNKSEIRDAI
ncbi:hypothetical protein LJC29_01560 [Bacteroides sp. OttesenSCG-928-N06]|nr:hypothetical protein [Bacteroides sp. OttesenSCG-928-N06]